MSSIRSRCVVQIGLAATLAVVAPNAGTARAADTKAAEPARQLNAGEVRTLFRGGVWIRLLPLGVATGNGGEYFYPNGRYEACGDQPPVAGAPYEIRARQVCVIFGRQTQCRTFWRDSQSRYFQTYSNPAMHPAFRRMAIEITPANDRHCNSLGAKP